MLSSLKHKIEEKGVDLGLKLGEKIANKLVDKYFMGKQTRAPAKKQECIRVDFRKMI